MIITIAGMPGSGKTTVGRKIAEALGYKHYSMGDLRGELAQKHGLTIDELNEVGKKEDWAHTEIDDHLAHLGKTQDNLVIDTWIGFHMVPHSVKIFLDTDLKNSAKRIFHDRHNRPDEADYKSEEEVETTLRTRIAATDAGFQRLYGVSFLDKSKYDLVVDTTDTLPEMVVGKIQEYIKERSR